MRITSEGFNDFKNTHRELKFDTMVDFVNEVKSPQVEIKKVYISALKKTAQCIVTPMDLKLQEVEEAKKKTSLEPHL
jgi:DnaJ-domain-containing protein 1